MSDASPVAPAALDQAERSRLVRLERTVDRAVEVAGKIAGEALATIRDEKLYRATHTTFADYVEARFGFSTSTAYRMIEAATGPEPREVEGLSHRGTNPQPTEPAREPESNIACPPLCNCPAGAHSQANLPTEDPEAAVTVPIEAARLWARVVATPLGSVVLAVDSSTAELPAAGARVLVAWER